MSRSGLNVPAARLEDAADAVPSGRIDAWIGRLTGWRRPALAFLLGGFLALALPPFGIWPLTIPCLAGLFLLVEGGLRASARAVRPWRAAAVGWAFGFGFCLAGLWWIAISFSMRSASLVYVAPVAVTALCAGLALFFGLAALVHTLATRILRPTLPGRIILFALCWSGAELARGHMLTGFPWNLLATVWTEVAEVAQGVALLGSYGLGLLTALAAMAPLLLLTPGLRRRAAIAIVAVLMLPLPALALWGAWRLPGAVDPAAPGRLVIRIVQPNVHQTRKWQADLAVRHVDTLVRLTAAPADGPMPQAIVWPETAVPYNLAGEPELVQAIARRGLVPGQVLLAGAPRVESQPDPQTGAVQRRVWNSLYAIDSTAAVLTVYDKFHLVPFGEYMPLKKYLPFGRMVPGGLDYGSGPGIVLMSVAGLPTFSPLICYEIIFPGQVIPEDGSGTRPQWLLNITNDAWFGESSGPYQHLASARFRAIEEGVPVIRAANTGISAAIDSYGRLVRHLPLGAQGYIDVPLPKTADRPTVFAWTGNSVLAIVFFILGAAVIGFSRSFFRLGMPIRLYQVAEAACPTVVCGSHR